ncbi:MAG: hypothetical protein IJS07_08940 [Bacteroidales bacterium]|nr:hypothetical protein [Bacteroidales bacterium]
MKKFFVFCFAALIAAACEEQKVAPEMTDVKAGFPYTLTATIGNVDATPAVKANFTDPTPANPATAKWSVDWKVGDEIRVFNQTGAANTVVYVVKSIADGKATFELKEGEDVSKFSEATTFFAATGSVADGASYPFLYNFNEAGEGGINTGLGSQKCVKENSIDNGFFNLVAKATLTDGSLNFQFIPVVSYIRLTIPAGLGFDIGCFYFQSGQIVDGVWSLKSPAGGTWNPSGFYRVRMNLEENTIKEIGSRSKGGSNNAPFYYGVGASKPSSDPTVTPYPAFVPGVYYFPVIPKCVINHLVIQDLSGAAVKTITFESPAFEAGKIYDFGTIPVPGPDFEAGDVIKVKGDGVADIDKDHHMSYLPKMNYHPDREVAPSFSDYCSYKNDGGTNPKAEFFNTWTGMYNAETDVWDKYFDYEIFVSLVEGQPLYLYTDKGAYIQQTGDFTWKDAAPADNGHEVGGKTSIEIVGAETPFFTVPTTDIYRIRFSTVTKMAYVSAISSNTSTSVPGLKRVILRLWPSQNGGYAGGGKGGDVDMTYKGHGVWTVEHLDFNTSVGYNGNSGNAGYKFLFGGLDSDQPTGKQYAVANSTSSAEGGYVAFDPANPDLNYWSMVPVQGGPWNNSGANGCWTYYPDLQGKGVNTITIYMNDTYGAYVHSIVAE